MRKAFRAYVATMGIGFRAAPWHATFQLITGTLMALAGPLGAYAGKLLIDAAVARDLGLGLVGAGLGAIAAGGVLVIIFYYVDCVFAVLERSRSAADRRLMELIGGVPGLAHHEYPEYLDEVQRIREERDGLSNMVNATAGVLRVSVTLTATGILLAQLHPALLFLPVLGFVSFWLGKRSRDLEVAAQEATSENERLRRHLFELGTSASSGKELRVFGLTDVVLERHHSVSDAVLRERDRAGRRGAILQGVDGLLSGLAYVGAIGFVLVLALDGRATPGDVVLAIGLALQMTMTVGTAVLYGTAFLRALRLARRFVWLEDYAVRTRRIPTSPAAVPDRLETGVELRSVSFGYGDRPVLTDISLTLPAGKVVALVGDNGAGKTTFPCRDRIPV